MVGVGDRSGTRGEEKLNSSWVVDVQKALAYSHPRRMEAKRWEVQSIYRVPKWVKDATYNRKAYEPKLVSLGPFHHGSPILLPMEEHKQRALVHLVKRSRKPLQDFISAIYDVAEELMTAYCNDLHVKWRNDRRSFVQVMLTDGCFLLEVMISYFRDYDEHDPIFSTHGKNHIFPIIRSDMLLIENQLPLLVLKKIIGVHPHTHPEFELDTIDINLMVLSFLGRELEGRHMADMSLRHHPLELYHESLVDKHDTGGNVSPWEDEHEIMPSALEIHEAGVKFRKSKKDNLLDIRFEDGVLSMPVMRVDDNTERLYLNLMAFERLHTGTGNLVMAYVFFMDNIIDSAKDVAILSTNGILGCDKETAKLFNGTMSRSQLLLLGPSTTHLHQVQSKVKAYHRKSWHKWRATLISETPGGSSPSSLPSFCYSPPCCRPGTPSSRTSLESTTTAAKIFTCIVSMFMYVLYSVCCSFSFKCGMAHSL